MAVVVLALWRARRLGRVVEEPLPVVVRAAETVEGRGRLYRAAGARDRAAEALRRGARDRLVPRLGLPAGADREALVGTVAVRTGRTLPRCTRSCTVRLPATTPRWCAWPTTWTASCP